MSMLSSPPSDAPEDLDPAAELPEDATAVSRRKRSLSRTQLVWRRLKRKPNFWIGGTFLTLIVGFALLGNIPNIYDLNQRDPYGFNAPPGAQHWFGADAIGIDLYASLTAAEVPADRLDRRPCRDRHRSSLRRSRRIPGRRGRAAARLAGEPAAGAARVLRADDRLPAPVEHVVDRAGGRDRRLQLDDHV